jgi:hypothetical protein
MVKVKIEKTGYDYKKGLLKLGKSALIVFLTGLVIVWQDDIKFVAIVPLIEYGLNYLKHSK